MWYRYFVKESWNLRLWRKANLKFNQDDYGMFRHKPLGSFSNFLFRLARTEGALRGVNFFFSAGLISVLIYLKSTYYDAVYGKAKLEAQAIDLQNKDNEAKAKLFFNKFGGPTRPQRSLDDLIIFMAGSWTYDQFADFLSYTAGMDINMDMQKGLDSWMGDIDKDQLKYYQKSVGRKVDI